MREAVGEDGATALEELEPRRGLEVTAQHELQREGALVVARVVGEQQFLEARVAVVGDAVRLAGAPARLRGLALPRRREVAVEGAGGRDRDDGEARGDALDRPVAFETAERGVQRPVRDAPQRAEGFAEPLAQLVAVEWLFFQESEDGEVEHSLLLR